MEYIVVFLGGAAASASALIIWYFSYLAILKGQKQLLKNGYERLKSDAFKLKQQATEIANRQNKVEEDIAYKLLSQEKELESRRQKAEEVISAQTKDFELKRQQINKEIAQLEAKKVSYNDMLLENNRLKKDLFNLSVQIRKMERDHASIIQHQEEINQKANQLGNKYLEDHVSWIGKQLTANNFGSCKQKLLNMIADCRGIGFDVQEEKEQALIEDLKKDFEKTVRDEFNRQEQARIKAQIREEEKLAREIEKQIQESEREQAAIKAALEKALIEAKEEHTAEVDRLEAKLKEAEEKLERAKSRAQLTKAGNVYVLSNIGSFGEGVFKIGMTRRLEPMDRVKELGDASVPFPFDVHMMISCDDAPTLENAIHRELHKQRLNKVNFRKEYFHADIESIRKIVESNHGEVSYVAKPEALQYYESINIKDEDYEFVEHTVESLREEEGAPIIDDL